MDWAQILVVILSIFLAIFLLLGIVLLVLVIKLTYQIKKVTVSARNMSERIERTVANFGKATSIMSLIQMVIKNFKTTKKSHKRGDDV